MTPSTINQDLPLRTPLFWVRVPSQINLPVLNRTVRMINDVTPTFEVEFLGVDK